MRTLVVGGTRFVGKHLVDALLARGHAVTLFNRGRTRPELFPDVEHLTGDRNADLSILADRSWDVVIDTCAYEPDQVKRLLDVVGKATDRYVLISTISVYGDPQRPGITEDAPRAALEDHDSAMDGGRSAPVVYGALKARCEDVACTQLSHDRVLVIRPGLIVGPEDYTGRFPYWVDRVARFGSVLVPGSPSNPLQVVDARDLAAFVVRCAELRRAGTLHVTGPQQSMTFGEALAVINAVADADVDTVWVEHRWLREQGVDSGTLPLTMGPGDPVDLMRVDIGRALASGLSLRPIGDTVADTLAWVTATTDALPQDVGLRRERERELIAAWNQRLGSKETGT